MLLIMICGLFWSNLVSLNYTFQICTLQMIGNIQTYLSPLGNVVSSILHLSDGGHPSAAQSAL